MKEFLIVAVILFVLVIVSIIIAIAYIISLFDDSNAKSHSKTKTTTKVTTRTTYSIPTIFLSPEIRNGREGEQRATAIIRSFLCEDDRLLTNITIEFEGKRIECDEIIINKYGVFIIEVKNYKGEIVGNEEDYEWTKYKTTEAGETYSKQVKNPLKQVKRQTYVLAKALKYYGIDVWVEGYALLLYCNSPVKSERMLESTDDINRVIHTPTRKRLSPQEIEKICNLLS